MDYLLFLPVLAGLLLWWVSRNDRRREFVQQRLHTLTRKGEETIAPILHREQAVSFALIPQDLRVRLDTEFAAAGKRIGLLHLLLAALIRDRKSTRLNSSHQIISYAVFCFKKKKTI